MPNLQGTITIDGTSYVVATISDILEIRSDGVYNMTQDEYVWQSQNTIVGLSSTQGATSPDSDMVVGDTLQNWDSMSFYSVVAPTISDLTGTTWLLNNSDLVLNADIFNYNIILTSNDTHYTGFSNTWTVEEGTDFVTLKYGSTVVYDGDIINASWYNEAYRTISITGGTDATNASLITWLMANATQVPTTDLTNTVWAFKDTGVNGAGNGSSTVNFSNISFKIDGTLADGTYISAPNVMDIIIWTCAMNITAGSKTVYYLKTTDNLYSSLSLTDGEGWYEGSGQNLSKMTSAPTIEFVGGTGIGNPDLLVWLSQNATMQAQPEPQPTGGIYFGTDTISGISFGDLTVSKIYYGEDLVYEYEEPAPASYVMGFRGMSTSGPSLTRAGDTASATWSATSGVISFDGIDISKIFGGYVGNDGEELTWDSTNLKYLHNGVQYTGNVFVKINRFFCKAYYENGVLDGYDLYFGNSAPDNTYQDWFLGKDHCIIGCYKARGGTGAYTNGLQSKQGLTHMDATTANAIVTAYKLNSSTAYSLHEKWYNENAILQVLFMAIFATRQTTDVFPEATYRHRSNDTRATGYMDSYRAQSLFAYEPTGDSGKRGNMFLGIEDFVGWGYELVGGVVLSGTSVCPTLDYANFSYSNTYTADLTLPSSDNYITQLQESATNAGLLVPKSTTGGSDTTYFCDYQWHGANCWYQGAFFPSAYYGLFFFYGAYDASNSYFNCAARLCGTPN